METFADLPPAEHMLSCVCKLHDTQSVYRKKYQHFFSDLLNIIIISLTFRSLKLKYMFNSQCLQMCRDKNEDQSY